MYNNNNEKGFFFYNHHHHEVSLAFKFNAINVTSDRYFAFRLSSKQNSLEHNLHVMYTQKYMVCSN